MNYTGVRLVATHNTSLQERWRSAMRYPQRYTSEPQWFIWEQEQPWNEGQPEGPSIKLFTLQVFMDGAQSDNEARGPLLKSRLAVASMHYVQSGA